MLYMHGWSQVLHQNKAWRWTFTVVIAALLGIAAGHTVLGSLGSVAVVDGVSMAPTYQPGARVYTAPISTVLDRGDIVLIRDPVGDHLLKRIVGLPGETVELWRGYVFINRKMLKEPYLPKYTYTFPDERRRGRRFQLGQDQYFVLGDNRLLSQDSRAYGPVDWQQIKSRVPLPANAMRARFAAYTLPPEGKRTIQPLP